MNAPHFEDSPEPPLRLRALRYIGAMALGLEVGIMAGLATDSTIVGIATSIVTFNMLNRNLRIRGYPEA